MESFLAFTKSDVKRFYKQALPFLLNKHNFVFESGNTIIRVSDYLIQGICLDRSSYNRWLCLNPFIWPLIIPIGFLPLGISRRVRYIDHTGIDTDWYQFDVEPQQIMYTINAMERNIREIALPFLDDSISIEKLASDEYQKSWHHFWGDTVSEDYYRCFLYAYVQNKVKFYELYERVKPICESDDREWAVKEWQRLQEIERNIDDIDVLKRIFQGHINFCIKNLKLEKFKIDTSLDKIMASTGEK